MIPWRVARTDASVSLLLASIQGGLHVFQIYDHYSCSGASLLLLSIFQSVAIGWVYGTSLSVTPLFLFPSFPSPLSCVLPFHFLSFFTCFATALLDTFSFAFLSLPPFLFLFSFPLSLYSFLFFPLSSPLIAFIFPFLILHTFLSFSPLLLDSPTKHFSSFNHKLISYVQKVPSSDSTSEFNEIQSGLIILTTG